jgi:hypothetical protein
VNIVVAPALVCPACAGRVLLSVDLPHPRFPWSTCRHWLCPRCQVNADADQGLLAFFAVSPVADLDCSDTLAVLVQQWLARLPAPPMVSPEAFEADVAAFHRGEFDECPDRSLE